MPYSSKKILSNKHGDEENLNKLQVGNHYLFIEIILYSELHIKHNFGETYTCT